MPNIAITKPELIWPSKYNEDGHWVVNRGVALPYPGHRLIPDEVRPRISKWSDYIDYWAVDWDFRDDTFMNHWQACRARQHCKLTLESETHEYSEPGRYQVLVKVVDIFGNDTSQLLVWETR